MKRDAIEAILSRRSVCKYTKEHVLEETITEVLHAAMSATSAGKNL